MNKLFAALVAFAAMTGAARAEPVALPENQLDRLTAGAVSPGDSLGVLVRYYVFTTIRAVTDPDQIPGAARDIQILIRSGQ